VLPGRERVDVVMERAERVKRRFIRNWRSCEGLKYSCVLGRGVGRSGAVGGDMGRVEEIDLTQMKTEGEEEGRNWKGD